MPRTINITTRKSKAEILRILRDLPRNAGASQAFLRRVGVALLGQIEKNYKTKARGGTDQCGLRWKPLAPYTLKLRHKLQQHRKELHYKRGKTSIPGVEVLRVTDRLLDSLTPAGPPDNAPISLNPDQILDVQKDSVEVGTSVEYAIYQHTGVPERHLPQRRLWPDPSRWTSAWWRPILQQAALAAGELIAKEIG